MEYLDFELEINKLNHPEYSVALKHSPAGEIQGKMILAFEQLKLDSRFDKLRIALLQSGGERRQLLTDEEQSVQEFGQILFDALFSREILGRFDLSKEEAFRQGKGLRIKLSIQPPELAQLPWEFLYDNRQAEHVSLSRSTPVVRYINLPHVFRPTSVSFPLKILGMVSSPSNLSRLDTDHEKNKVEEAIYPLQLRRQVELTWLDDANWQSLQKALRDDMWHIFHYIGHGGFDKIRDEGFIVLEDNQKLAYMFRASSLAKLVGDTPTLRLVVLNACEGGKGSEKDIFSSTASILVRRGIPAVIAMQYSITDRAAIEFSRSFYESLSEGIPIDASVSEARKAVSLYIENTLEWGVPVLYMHCPDGVLFNLDKSSSEKYETRKITKEKQPQEKQQEESKPLLTPIAKNILLNLESDLRKSIIGQDKAIKAISKVLRRAYAGFHENDRPLGSFVFIGSSGTGKTLLARKLAEILFGNEKKLIEIDASEFMERHTISRLVGAPPGYIGYEEAGQLTEAVRRQPQSVIFFENMEKAHPEFHNFVQSILGSGYCSDGRGRKIDFTNTIIIMTTNVSDDKINEISVLGFSQNKEPTVVENENVKIKLTESLKRIFRPEFINRVDEIIFFSKLTQEHLYEIVDLEVANLNRILEKTNVMISLTDEARGYLATISFDETRGARRVKQVIREYIQDRLAIEMLNDRISDARKILINLDPDNELVFERL